MTALLAAVVLMADGGAARLDVKQLVGEAFMGEADVQRIAELKALATKAAPAERALLLHTVALLESTEPMDTLVPRFLPLLKEATAYAKGSFPDELAFAGAYASLEMTAQNAQLDPAPYRAAALAYGKDLVARYPKEGRAHGVLASLLFTTSGDPDLARTELKTCATLGEASCVERYRAHLAELERPRCTGATMKQPLSVWGAVETSAKGPRVVTYEGQTLEVEPKPFLEAGAFSFVGVDPDGAMALETTKADAARLERETRRLLRKYFVLKLGDEVLLAAQVQSAIAGGRLRITRGRGKPPFTLDDLCKTIARPRVPASYRLE